MAAVAWVANPGMADGDLTAHPIIPVTTLGKDGLSFEQHFPSEGAWAKAASIKDSGADSYYKYTIDMAGGVLGGSPGQPAVLAEGWGGPADGVVYATQVQAGGIGMASNYNLSGCRSGVETVSTSY